LERLNKKILKVTILLTQRPSRLLQKSALYGKEVLCKLKDKSRRNMKIIKEYLVSNYNQADTEDKKNVIELIKKEFNL
jgi:hypothetical protein